MRSRYVLLSGIVVVFTLFSLASFWLSYNQRNSLCDFQGRSWRIDYEQINGDAIPQKPSEAVLRAFPAFRPFYDPKNPLYAEQLRSLDKQRDRRLAVLGPRPSC